MMSHFLQDKSDAGSVSSDLSAAIATELRFRGGKFVQVESTIEHDEERIYLAQALLGMCYFAAILRER